MEVTAACHAHSSWSYDGSWTLESLAETFGRRGHRVLMMTEHDRGFTADRFARYREACARATTDRVCVLPGIEYSDSANRIHVLVWGDIPFLGEGLDTGVLLERVAEHGGVAVLAHPARRAAWELFRPHWARLLLGIEMWNRKYDGWAPSNTGTALLEQAGSIPFVGLDFHTERQLFPLVMSIDIDGPVDERGILEALRMRRCSGTALGVPVGGPDFQKRLGLLRMVERGRRSIAQLIRAAR